VYISEEIKGWSDRAVLPFVDQVIASQIPSSASELAPQQFCYAAPKAMASKGSSWAIRLQLLAAPAKRFYSGRPVKL
jgi:hypothetical protein